MGQEAVDEREPTLQDLLKMYADQDLDLIIVEGFKHEPFSKIEVHRSSIRRPLLARNDTHIIAVATDSPDSIEVDVETLDLDNHTEIAKFILDKMQNKKLTLAFEDN